MKRENRLLRWSVAMLAAVGLAATAVPISAAADGGGGGGHKAKVDFTLKLLHNNDGESQLIDAGEGLEDFGGVARFARVVRRERRQAYRRHQGAILVSSGDNFLAGPEFNASLEDPKGRWFDAIALDLIGYDAIQIGNHDFDFGPETLARFISEGFREPGTPPYVAGNLDFSAEPSLQALVDDEVIVDTTVVETKDVNIGIVGAVTPNLPFITSLGDVTVDPDVAGTIQAGIDELTDDGIEIIIVISHLQGIEEDLALVQMLDDVDAMVAGGGDEILANPGDLLVPGDVAAGDYPQVGTDMDGDQVPIVTTAGNYKYLGELRLDFDEDGNVVRWKGGPIRVAGGDQPDAVRPVRRIERKVVEPVSDYVAGLATQQVATSEVGLNAIRTFIRSVETNEGNLIADSYLAAATQAAPSFGVAAPDVALTNGGGIRNDNILPAGPLTALNTFEMLPFANVVTVVENVERQAFKDLLENTVARIGADGVSSGSGTGRFLQAAGFRVEYDSTGTAAVIDIDGNITTPGTRVQEVVLDDGTEIVTGGAVVAGGPLVAATNAFSAGGGDQWDFGSAASITTVGLTDQQALQGFLVNDLGGLVAAADYPEDAGDPGPCAGERIINTSSDCVGPVIGP